MDIEIKNIYKALPETAKKNLVTIGDIANELNTDIFLVGGPVRDFILGKKSIDLDIAVPDDGIRFATILANRINGDIKVYRERLTATVILPDLNTIDVATLRNETYDYPGSLPAVKPISDIVTDLSRRDFTINAMAIKLNSKTTSSLVDPFNGYNDVHSGIIKFLHNKSFIDDPTRILRAIRFEIRLGFRIEEQTLKALKNAIVSNAHKTISGQRYIKEINLYLDETKPLRFLERAYELGIMTDIIPDRGSLEEVKNIFGKIENEKKIKNEHKKLLLFSAMFLHDTTNEITNKANYFGMTKKQRNTIIDTKLILNVLKNEPGKIESVIKRYGDHAKLLAYIVSDNKILFSYIKNELAILSKDVS